MATKVGPTDVELELKFGGGIHSRASEDEIDARECASGQNFDLDPQNTDFRNRKPFDKIGTVPNGSAINGFVSLLKSDGTNSMLVQAGDTVYQWDGLTTFTSKGTVSSSAKLRGRLSHNWQLADKVLITDLTLNQPVMEWDGTTLANTSFTNETGAAFGTFNAKYCTIQNERAIFANVKSNGTATPHLVVGSKRGVYTQISVSQRAASSLSDLDPYFLIQPDYRVINGFVEAFGTMVTSSLKGDLFKIDGTNAQNFIITPFYPRSGASGNESLVYIGNNIVYGRDGVIESVADTDRYGDVEANDLSLGIADLVEDFTSWTNVYNSRLQRVYFFPSGESQIWVLHKSMIGGQVSPWSKWVTLHASAFSPTAVMNCIDPQDGLEYVFMGDSSGNLYRLEGTGTSGDAGNTSITTERLSPLFNVQLDGEVFNISGTIWYRKNLASTVTLSFEYSGQSAFNETVTLSLPAISNTNVYGGSYYGGAYYGTAFSGRLVRQKFGTPGRGNALQVRVTASGASDVEIHKLHLRFEAVS